MQLNELISTPETLYHYTSIGSLRSILRDKKINLTADMGSDSEITHRVGKNIYYLSTARNKTGDYTLGHLYKEGVVLNLDRSLIKSRYKVRSVDYWGKSSGSDEQEDRVYSSRSSMPLSVIASIHILMEPRKSGYSASELKIVLESIVMAKRYAIDVFLYDNRANMLHQRNPVNITEFFKKNSIRDDSKPYSSMKRSDFLAPFRELHYKKKKSELSPRARSMIDPYYLDVDFITQMKATLHNERSSRDRTAMEKTIKMFKELGISSVREYRDYLVDKWKGA